MTTLNLPLTQNSAPVIEYRCLYTSDLRRKQKRWQDGRVKYHTFNKRVMVYDERSNFVGDTHWREDDAFDEGQEVELERGGLLVQVSECIGKSDQDLSELTTKRIQEREQRRKDKAISRTPSVQPSDGGTLSSPSSLKSLAAFLGSRATCRIRSTLLTTSPYEQRRQTQAPAEETVLQSTNKRRKLDTPTKNGYAQNLTGATLNLTGSLSSVGYMKRNAPWTQLSRHVIRSEESTLNFSAGRGSKQQTSGPSPKTIFVTNAEESHQSHMASEVSKWRAEAKNTMITSKIGPEASRGQPSLTALRIRSRPRTQMLHVSGPSRPKSDRKLREVVSDSISTARPSSTDAPASQATQRLENFAEMQKHKLQERITRRRRSGDDHIAGNSSVEAHEDTGIDDRAIDEILAGNASSHPKTTRLTTGSGGASVDLQTSENDSGRQHQTHQQQRTVHSLTNSGIDHSSSQSMTYDLPEQQTNDSLPSHQSPARREKISIRDKSSTSRHRSDKTGAESSGGRQDPNQDIGTVSYRNESALRDLSGPSGPPLGVAQSSGVPNNSTSPDVETSKRLEQYGAWTREAFDLFGNWKPIVT